MPTLDWLNRADAVTTAAQAPYRLLEPVSVHRAASVSPLLPLGEGRGEGRPSGTHDNLLIQGDKRPAGGNVLTAAVLDALLALHAGTPDPSAALVVYGEACRLGAARLKLANLPFRHIP